MYPLLEIPYVQRPNLSFLTVPMSTLSEMPFSASFASLRDKQVLGIWFAQEAHAVGCLLMKRQA